MTTYEDRLNTEYEACKHRNDWQGMAAVHAERMRLRTASQGTGPSHDGEALLIAAEILVALAILFTIWAVS